jgi:hypothetical protein
MKPIFLSDRRISWAWLSTHAEVLYLEQHLDKVDWGTISRNPNAMPLIEEQLEQRLDQFSWMLLSANPSVMSLLSKPHLLRLCEHNSVRII